MKSKTLATFLLCILFLFVGSSFLFGQDCIDDDKFYFSQNHINNFPSSYPGCSIINGNLLISEANLGNITNLDSLNQITTIKGDLIINDNRKLNSLAGLENLETVEGTLVIGISDSLKTVTLSSLKSVGNLIIGYNKTLKNLNGLQSLKHVLGDLEI